MDRSNSLLHVSEHALELHVISAHVTGNSVQKAFGAFFDDSWAANLDNPSKNQSMAIRHEACGLRADLRRDFIALQYDEQFEKAQGCRSSASSPHDLRNRRTGECFKQREQPARGTG